MHIPYSVLPSFPHATSSRVYTQWHMAQSPKSSLWPLVTGLCPIPSAGSVYDDLRTLLAQVVLAGAWLVVVMAPKLAPHVGVPQFWSVSLPLFLTKTSGGQVALALSTFWHAKWFTRMLNLNTFCYRLPTFVSHAHTLFCPPFFPQRHLVTSIYSMAHGAVIETFLVASRYRYIPNTLGRKRSR